MIHYPKGLPFTEAYQYLHHTSVDFPVTFRLQDELLSLPVYPELTDAEVTYVATCIRNYFSR
jgi:dTDP-4-amino-4,6-dideoxygalactose transaminase